MTNFSNKTVLVTGASGGIGQAIAHEFAAAGASVVVHFNNNERAAKRTLDALKGDSHRLARADLTNPDELPNLVQTISKGMGKIDVLVNNAGIFEVHPIVDLEYEEWQAMWHKTVAVNLLGPAHLSFCVAKHMMQFGGGKIVNIGSRGAFRGEPDAPAYGATKAGLHAMSQSLAKAMAPHNIYFYAIAPGFVETERVAPFLDGPQGDDIRNQSPLGRVARPEEVARTALFLASEGTEFLTGCIVDVNGASYLRS